MKSIKKFIKMLIIVFTPFIVTIVDAINGVCLYMQVEGYWIIDKKLEPSTEHSAGSSLLLIGYVICRSKHMCKYYKYACWSIVAFHAFAELYIFTGITYLWFAYISWVIHSISFVLCVIYILGKKTHRLIRQFYKRE